MGKEINVTNFTEDGKEIIARKKSSIKGLHIFGLVAFPILIVAVIALLVAVIVTDEADGAFIGLGVGLIAVCIGSFVFSLYMLNKFNATPDNLITYKDGVLYIGLGTCNPAKISNIQHKENWTVKGKFSNFKIYTDTGFFELNFVDDYEKVIQRLNELKVEVYQKAVAQAQKEINAEKVENGSTPTENNEVKEAEAKEEATEAISQPSQAVDSGENNG